MATLAATTRSLFLGTSRRVNIGRHTFQKACFSTNNETKDTKGIGAKLWDKYSFSGQSRRIEMGERLFRAAQQRASNPTWYSSGMMGREFRPRHAVLTMHLWFLHRRLVTDKVDPSFCLMIQEELFDILWHDTKVRIRAEGCAELTINKHLKDVQQYTFQHLTHYDHCFTELMDKPKERYETLGGLVWRHLLLQDEEAPDDLIKRLAHYIEYQHNNICLDLPDEYFHEGRIAWGDMPDFSGVKDNTGKLLEDIPEHPDDVLPTGWLKAMADNGDSYYWKPETMHSQWERPV
mmetsp:Transcript_4726/g.7186  ORF Transcript_4726/g.7186 Transcript_4726/m.7186 type:complete len:291 (+) Transcript_4726:27-899(+)